jgi:hypothetical protein
VRVRPQGGSRLTSDPCVTLASLWVLRRLSPTGSWSWCRVQRQAVWDDRMRRSFCFLFLFHLEKNIGKFTTRSYFVYIWFSPIWHHLFCRDRKKKKNDERRLEAVTKISDICNRESITWVLRAQFRDIGCGLPRVLRFWTCFSFGFEGSSPRDISSFSTMTVCSSFLTFQRLSVKSKLVKSLWKWLIWV